MRRDEGLVTEKAGCPDCGSAHGYYHASWCEPVGGFSGRVPKPVPEAPGKPTEAPIWTAEERDAVVTGLRAVAEAVRELVEGQARLERALKGGAVGQWEEPAVGVRSS